MKHFLLFLGSNLLVASLAQAQVGVRAGTNLLNLRPEAAGARPSTSNKLGYQVGVFYQQPLTKHLSLVPEVQFSREQTQVEYADVRNEQNYLRGSYDLHWSHINVPVLLRYTLGRVHFEAGPQASLLVGGRGTGQLASLSGGDILGDRNIDQAAIGRYRRVSFGASLGVGVSLPAGLGIDVRAYQGFSSINHDTPSQENTAIPYWGGAMNRQTLQASLTYQLASR